MIRARIYLVALCLSAIGLNATAKANDYDASVLATGDESAATAAADESTSASSPSSNEASDLWSSYRPTEEPIETTTQPALVEWADYRMRTMFASHTTYQFGTDTNFPGPQYAPLSKLQWSLDSMWQGLQIGFEKPRWGAHFEWLTPMLHNSFGEMNDFDWSGADRPPALLSTSPQHWSDAQMLELEGTVKIFDRILTLPVEFWTIAGYRYQRFGMMAYNGVQVINDDSFQDPNIPQAGYRWHEEMISLNQEYNMGYVGGQLRTTWNAYEDHPVLWKLQADWAGTAGYNCDHHISGYEASGVHRYTYDITHGDAIHVALMAETPLSQHISVGAQGDYTAIRTTGTHRWTMSGNTLPVDDSWTNGVKADSDQASITGFIRAQF